MMMKVQLGNTNLDCLQVLIDINILLTDFMEALDEEFDEEDMQNLNLDG